MSLKISILTVLLILAQSCSVSFINVGIDYSTVSTFSIEQFEPKSGNAPPTSGQQFSEQLKNKVLNNTRLSYRDEEGDVQFKGDIVGYTVTALAPQPNQTVALQRLTIRVAVNYTNTKLKEEEENSAWSQTFSRFADFGSDQDLVSVEEQLIEEIYDQILEDVFNKAFSGW